MASEKVAELLSGANNELKCVNTSGEDFIKRLRMCVNDLIDACEVMDRKIRML